MPSNKPVKKKSSILTRDFLKILLYMDKYIYLHGFASSPESSKAQFFNKKFQQKGIELFIPDLNEPTFSTLTISRMKRQVGAQIKKSKSVIIIGSSLGGLTAALLAQRYKNVRAIILMAPAFEISTRRVSGLSKRELEQWSKKGYRNHMHYAHNKEYPLHFKFSEDAAKQDAISLKRKVPALVFHGINDTVVPYEVSVRYLEKQGVNVRLFLLSSDHSLGNSLEIMWAHTTAFLDSLEK